MARRTRFHTRRRFLTTGANLGFLVLTCTCVPLVVVSPWLALGVFVGVFVVWGVILAKVPPRGGRRFYEITDEALIVETTDSRTVVPWQDIEHLLHRPTAMTREGLDDVTHWEVLTLYLADGDRIDIHGVHGQYRLSKQIVARCRDRIVQRLRTAFERDGEVTYGALHLSPAGVRTPDGFLPWSGDWRFIHVLTQDGSTMRIVGPAKQAVKAWVPEWTSARELVTTLKAALR